MTYDQNMSESLISEVIALAWSDKSSFESISIATGLSEPDVIALMRSHLKPSSFRLWRKRVNGRKSKHAGKLSLPKSSNPDQTQLPK